jgi:hypothetical protein
VKDSFWPIPADLWAGKTAVILAGGPSLSLAQVRRVAMARLEDRCRVMAVNDAVFVAWFADWLHACDFKWWNWHRLSVTKFPGVKTTLTPGCPPGWGVKRLRNASGEGGQMGGFPEPPDTVAPGGNGGYQAIQCAVKAGASRVILLGFDMKPAADGGGHWFGDHPDGMRSEYESTMLPHFKTLVAPLKDRGIEVINCTPGSALTCFPAARLEDVLC